MDYWCEEDLAWKSGTVTSVNFSNGTLTLMSKKGLEKGEVLSTSSRRLAPHRFFTKEEPPARSVDLHISPMQEAPLRNFEAIRMRMDDRPRMLGMPLFLGYYWRGNDDIPDRGGFFDSLDPFNF
jgi:hypothetical protein